MTKEPAVKKGVRLAMIKVVPAVKKPSVAPVKKGTVQASCRCAQRRRRLLDTFLTVSLSSDLRALPPTLHSSKASNP